MKINFVTTNRHKFEEAKSVLAEYDVELEQLDREYNEPQEATIEEVASYGAKVIADETGVPTVADDTGFYFDAYTEFPGVLSKFVYNAIGYEGLLKLLEDKNRSAHARTVAAYCVPGERPIVFDGEYKGVIAEEAYDLDKDVMPFARIFVPDGYDVTFSRLPIEEINKTSPRAIAFRKLGEYLRERS